MHKERDCCRLFVLTERKVLAGHPQKKEDKGEISQTERGDPTSYSGIDFADAGKVRKLKIREERVRAERATDWGGEGS